MSLLPGTRRAEAFEAFTADPERAIELICDAIVNDRVRIGQFAHGAGIPSRRLKQWIIADPERVRRYTEAVAMLQDDTVLDAHDALMHAEDKDECYVRDKQLNGALAVAKHWNPERYSEKVQHQLPAQLGEGVQAVTIHFVKPQSLQDA